MRDGARLHPLYASGPTPSIEMTIIFTLRMMVTPTVEAGAAALAAAARIARAAWRQVRPFAPAIST